MTPRSYSLGVFMNNRKYLNYIRGVCAELARFHLNSSMENVSIGIAPFTCVLISMLVRHVIKGFCLSFRFGKMTFNYLVITPLNSKLWIKQKFHTTLVKLFLMKDNSWQSAVVTLQRLKCINMKYGIIMLYRESLIYIVWPIFQLCLQKTNFMFLVSTLSMKPSRRLRPSSIYYHVLSNLFFNW